MCKYCEGDAKILGETDTGCCTVGIWIENNKIEHLYDYDTGKDVEINFCPMCGRKLKED